MFDPVPAVPDEVSARLHAWRRTGDSGALWPQVSESGCIDAHRCIAAVTRAVLNRTGSLPRVEGNGDVIAAAWSVGAYVSGMGITPGCDSPAERSTND